ncbi:UDP-glucose--hexose-1-phosphate uridylyltransferase [Pontibacter sp. G13]|uniref:UDP-glucose--hexose-1-phosphate uridylyltransferase n=1 Tax=Pontibacter sp. G13 TaxID=3074898 RepID=UPI0028890A76|nr:UDP-glucose--hexose-1-phosphate uridylyltransferase [Pontibacter sp. G13]WNJ17350.1 UDP-glucose--hexose-1-phosphate uridylyltransferase [Pontibacter sp. G13]
MNFDHLQDHPHKRQNILTGDWVLVSPHRTKRPWQGKVEKLAEDQRPSHDPNCYLCAGNTRAGGKVMPEYTGTYVFTNDFSALLNDTPDFQGDDELFSFESESGECRVVCFHPNHALTLPEMEIFNVEEVVRTWQDQYAELGARPEIGHVMIFENKGATMGCSNPHPHGQIWSQKRMPQEVQKKHDRQQAYFDKHGRTMLSDYISRELADGTRVLEENDHFVSLVPFWALWPYEVMIIPKRAMAHIGMMTEEEVSAYAAILHQTTVILDNLFETSFPYSSGIHQAPTDGAENAHWHWHMSFYPPLLRSATVKKFMVGYEMFANPQRDITAEQAAAKLKSLPKVHYKSLSKVGE